jgi:predicted ribosome quality control (RQC) complex YloA/Tae2 family protein
VSNAILFDPPFVRALAGELNERLRGRACASAPIFAAERTAVLPLDRGEALQLDLHPTRGWLRMVPWESDPGELDAICEGVTAPPDERLLVIHLRSTDRFRAQVRRLVVELHTNQWNALVVADEDERILSLLWSRSAGGRALRSGAVYHPPPPPRRFGAETTTLDAARAHWRATLGPIAPESRRATLLAGFAYVGSANAEPILGEALRDPGEDALREAFERWWALRSLSASTPVLLRLGGRSLPYPTPLPGIESTPVASLLAGIGRVAAASEDRIPAPVLPGTAAVRRRVEAAARRVERLEGQIGGSEEVERMRFWGDLLLARKRLVPHGAESVRLQDWTGALVEVALDPALGAAENANRWYDEARRREHANARIPALLEAARAELARWTGALEAAEKGELPAWAAEAVAGPADANEKGAIEEESRPYRRYRTSGGLEVRVGRSARANDELTFRHSAPGDVWLHAQSVPGSHVILRWRILEGSPPARDLEEAATLAALFSKARSSALVPVDWTRRKHVRKPRGSAPGAVIPLQVRTLLVRPDAAIEERMRDD